MTKIIVGAWCDAVSGPMQGVQAIGSESTNARRIINETDLLRGA
jgi:hypothetical protein